MKRIVAMLLVLVLLCGCSAPVEVEAPADSSMLADGAEGAAETEPAENIGAEETKGTPLQKEA